MTKLSDLKIKPVYDTDDDIRSFYNEVLFRAKEYKRASAYFTNGFYRFIQKGLFQFLKSEGRMKLLLSTEIDSNVLNDIKDGLELKSKKQNEISDFIDQSFGNLNELKEQVSIISYLIAIDRLDIKFVFKEKGLFHDKYAIFEDNYSNILIASGSNNETGASVEINHESFETTINWDQPSKHELLKIDERNKRFEDTWNNNVPSLLVIPMLEVIKENLINRLDFEKIKIFETETSFIRFSIDDDKVIRIQTSIDKSQILDDYKFRFIKPFVESFNKTCIVLMPLKSIKDIIETKNVVEEISKKLKVRFVETENYKNFIEKNFVDLENLSQIGLKIKDSKLLSADEEFNNFSRIIQSLLKRTLKNSQLQSAFHLFKLKRVMNFSVPGSGKTATILGAFEYLNSLSVSSPDFVDKLLVIGPLNCFKSWQDEYGLVSKKFQKFDSNQFLNLSEAPTQSVKKTLLKYNQSPITLVNFDVIVSLRDFLYKVVDNRTMIVFDEIHRIKNYNSEKLPVLINTVNNAKYRIALTGTPLPNGYLDLYSMFTLLYGDYAQTYFNMHKDDLNRADLNFEDTGIESKEINSKIFPFFTRVSKHDLNVPISNPDHIIEIETTELENKIYEAALGASNNSFGKSIKLTQIACIPEQAMSKEEPSDYEINQFSMGEGETNSSICYLRDDNLMTSKLKKIIEIVKSLNRKVVVWCVFVNTIEKVTKLLNLNGISTKCIYGETDQNERSNIIDNFNNKTDYMVLVTNPHTLAESVSLHHACHDAIYVELNYNLSHYLQSRDRIHRLGLNQKQETNYYILINKYFGDKNKSIDYLIYKRLLKKEKRMIAAIDSGALLYKDSVNVNDYDELIKEIKDKFIS